MNNWKETTLDTLVEITSSKRVFHADYVENGVPFYRSKEIIEKQKGQNISTPLFITEEKYNDIKNKFGILSAGDLLLTSVGTLGVPYVVKGNEKFYFKDGNLTWFKNFNELNVDYLYYWFLSSIGKEALNSITIGSTQSAVTIVGLKNLCIKLPSFLEQKVIAKVLSSLDDKIELLRKQNETLEKIAQTIFRQWFVEFEFPDKNGKSYKSSGGKMIESELGKIPEGWRVGKLGDEFEIIMGQSPKGETYNETGDGMIFFQGRAEFQERFPKVRLHTTEPKRIAEKFDVLVSVRAPVGDINVAFDQCCIGRGVGAVRSKYKSYCLYKIKSLKDIFKKFEADGTVFGSINKDSFSNIEVVLSGNNEVVGNFEKIINSMDKKIFNNHNQIQTLSQLRDTLLPKLMSGEVRVK